MTSSTIKWPVAPKVKWSALASALLALIITGLPSILSNAEIVQGLPDWVVILLGVIVSGGGTFAAGYSAPHQERPIGTSST